MSQSLSKHKSLNAILSTPCLRPSPSRCNWSYVAFYPIHVMVCGAVGVCTRSSRVTESKHHMETRSWGLRRPSVGQVIVSSAGRWSRLLREGVFFGPLCGGGRPYCRTPATGFRWCITRMSFLVMCLMPQCLERSGVNDDRRCGGMHTFYRTKIVMLTR